MKKIAIAASLFLASLAGMAQINVFSGNNVGIGAGLATSASTLSVNTTGYNYSAVSILPANINMNRGILVLNIPTLSTNVTGLGSVLSSTTGGYGATLRAIWGSACNAAAQASGQAFGVIGQAGNCSNGYNVGVWGNLTGTNAGAAVFGSTGTLQPVTDNAQYAGYFVGKVKINGELWTTSGTISGSDKRIKKNIASLDSSDRIYSLQPKKYFLKTRKELIADGVIKQAVSDTGSVEKANLAEETPEANKKQHYGFLAQDLQKVYPEMVYTSADGTLGVDYQGFIPIIIAQLQTLKQQLDAKDARITALELALAKLKK